MWGKKGERDEGKEGEGEGKGKMKRRISWARGVGLLWQHCPGKWKNTKEGLVKRGCKGGLTDLQDHDKQSFGEFLQEMTLGS